MRYGKGANGQPRPQAFTLLELSVVLVLVAIILGMGFVTFTANLQAAQYNATVSRMDEIDKALLDYAVANNRIPCPADLTFTSASANYGAEAGASVGGTATGDCVTGMTPAANFKSASGAEEGGLPTRALQLPDEYMYDGWGRKFRYAVDPSMTKASALPYPMGGLCSASASGLTVNDASGAPRTTTGIYAIISHGANGHGAYTSSGVTVNAGSVNADELTNCHCNSSGAATTYSPTYVEKVPMQNATNPLGSFDDIVTFKEGWQMQAVNYPLAAKLQCIVIYVADTGNNRIEEFTTTGVYVAQFGTSGQGTLNAPQGVTVDKSGNVWVADTGNNRIVEFNSAGTYVGAYGSSGSGNGQFNQPAQLVADSGGNVWVTDFGNNRVEELSSGGAYESAFGGGGSGNGQFSNPYGIAIDPSGDIWVVDYTNHRAEEFSSSGTYVTQLGTTGGGPGQFDLPMGIAATSGGTIWVSDGSTDRIEEFTGANPPVYVTQFGSPGSGNGQLNYPYSLSIDPPGNIWVADNLNDRVQEFTSSGTYVSQFGTAGSGNGQLNHPASVFVTSR